MTEQCKRCGRFARNALCAPGKGCSRPASDEVPAREVREGTENAGSCDPAPGSLRTDDESDANRSFEVGVRLAEEGRLAEAEEAFGHADERGHAAAAVNLGVLFEDRGDTAGAEGAYRRADHRGDANGAFNLAELLSDVGRLAEAEQAYRRAEERGDAAAALNLGVLLEERGDTAGAKAAYRRADDRETANRAFEVGVRLAEEGRLAEAEEAFGHADERGHAAAAVNLGVLLEDRGDTAGAEGAYRRADHRGDANGAFNLAELLRDVGRLAEAEQAYRRAEERGDEAAALNLGVLLEDRGDTAGAQAVRRSDDQGGWNEAVKFAAPTVGQGRPPEADGGFLRVGDRGQAAATSSHAVRPRDRGVPGGTQASQSPVDTSGETRFRRTRAAAVDFARGIKRLVGESGAHVHNGLHAVGHRGRSARLGLGWLSGLRGAWKVPVAILAAGIALGIGLALRANGAGPYRTPTVTTGVKPARASGIAIAARPRPNTLAPGKSNRDTRSPEHSSSARVAPHKRSATFSRRPGLTANVTASTTPIMSGQNSGAWGGAGSSASGTGTISTPNYDSTYGNGSRSPGNGSGTPTGSGSALGSGSSNGSSSSSRSGGSSGSDSGSTSGNASGSGDSSGSISASGVVTTTPSATGGTGATSGGG